MYKSLGSLIFLVVFVTVMSYVCRTWFFCFIFAFLNLSQTLAIDAELSSLVTTLWHSDVNAAVSRDLHYSYQKYSSTTDTTDHAPQRFFTYVNENYLFHKPTYRAFLNLLNNYYPAVGTAEHETTGEESEQHQFISAICQTSIMQKTQQFLHQKAFLNLSQTLAIDAELSSLVTTLWHSDVNAAVSRDLHYSYQKYSSTTDTTDHAPQRFFTYVNENYLFHKPTYRAFLNLLNNYYPAVGTAEHETTGEESEQHQFISAICQTSIMQKTQQFLHQKGHVGSSMSDFEQKLLSIWFTMYPRQGRSVIKDSSGFEHVFVGETKGTTVDGFHNWIQFYLEEKKGHVDYLGYVFKSLPEVLGVHFKWYNSYKKLSSLVLGSSPEFEMAIYTLCYYLHRNRDCSFTMNGHTFHVKTYEVDYVSSDQIATAYF